MLQEDFFPCQRHKNTVNCSVGSSQAPKKKTQESAKECPKWTSKKRLVIFSSFFPPQTPKSAKTTAGWRILGGRRQGRPRVAKANAARYHKTRRSIAGFKGCHPRARRSWGGWQGAGWKARRNAWSWGSRRQWEWKNNNMRQPPSEKDISTRPTS